MLKNLNNITPKNKHHESQGILNGHMYDINLNICILKVMHCMFQANMKFKLATFTSLNAIFGLFMFPKKKKQYFHLSHLPLRHFSLSNTFLLFNFLVDNPV